MKEAKKMFNKVLQLDVNLQNHKKISKCINFEIEKRSSSANESTSKANLSMAKNPSKDNATLEHLLHIHQ